MLGVLFGLMLGFMFGCMLGCMLGLCQGWSLHGPHVGKSHIAIDRDHLVAHVQVRAVARDEPLLERLG